MVDNPLKAVSHPRQTFVKEGGVKVTGTKAYVASGMKANAAKKGKPDAGAVFA